jgi:hypothetical protein
MCHIWAAGAEKLNTHHLLTKLTPSRRRHWYHGGVVLAQALPVGSSLRLLSDCYIAAAIAYVLLSSHSVALRILTENGVLSQVSHSHEGHAVTTWYKCPVSCPTACLPDSAR